MNIKQTEAGEENNFKTLYVGFGEAEVVAINPTREEILELLEVSEENQDKFKEPEYIGEKDGVKTCKVTFYMKSVKTGKINQLTFNLKNEVAQNGNKDKNWWINQLGDTQCVDNEDNLFSSFKNFESIKSWNKDGEITPKYVQGAKPQDIEVIERKQYRQALYGEIDLVNFLKSYVYNFNYKNTEASFLLNTSKLFTGNFKELQDLLNDGYTKIGVAYSVRTTEEGKEYQNIEKVFCPFTEMRFVNNFRPTSQNLEALVAKYNDSSKRRKLTKWEMFIAQLNNTSYPIKNHFIFQPVTEYDPAKNVVAQDEAVISETSSDYL